MISEIESCGSWLDPATGQKVEMTQIIQKILNNKNYSVHVGTDSHRTKNTYKSHTFATVVCLYEEGKGADYYFRRITTDSQYGSLRQRIMEEVSYSLDIALMLMKVIPSTRIVVHADVNSDPSHKTFNFLGPIKSWVSSVGFKFRCKPDSWASSGVADKHAK